MPVSKAQQKAVKKYMQANYDEIKIRVSKGQKEVIQTHAKEQGQSTNAYIIQAIDERIEREQENKSASPQEQETSGE